MEIDEKSVKHPKKRVGTGGRKYRYQKKIQYDSELHKYYPNNIWFYDTPPEFTISLHEFENYALDRLKLMRIIERVNMSSAVKYSPEYRDAILRDLRKLGLSHFVTLMDRGHLSGDDDDEIYLALKYDHISHYILQLAYCRTEDLRKWLISMEMDFMGCRLGLLGNTSISELISRYRLSYVEAPISEKEQLKYELMQSTFYMTTAEINALSFYKVEFIHALDLVKTRKVFLKDGFAYVPYTKIISILLSKFRERFSESLAKISKLIPVVQQDERLEILLKDFDKKYTGSDFVSTKDKGFTAEQLPDLAKKSFPLCMKSLYDVVATEHHLKHFGRLQLGLFFKGIGLPLGESVRYWRHNFTQKADIDSTRFDKQYLYNIRHMYGKEGKRADYTPYNCMKVIMQSVGPGDHHGCPFRHSDATPLRAKLVAAEIPSTGIKEILDLVEKHHYQIACQKYFEWTHNQATPDGGIIHPNQYVEESQRVLQGKQSIKAATPIPTLKVNVFKDGSSRVKSEVLNLEECMNMDDDDDEFMSQLEDPNF